MRPQASERLDEGAKPLKKMEEQMTENEQTPIPEFKLAPAAAAEGQPARCFHETAQGCTALACYDLSMQCACRNISIGKQSE